MGRVLVVACVIGAAIYMWTEAAGYPSAARRLPRLLAVVVGLLGALALVQAVLRLAAERRAGAPGPLAARPSGRGLVIGVGFVALIAAYIWSIPRLGYLVATPLMMLLPLAALRPVGWGGIGLAILAVTGTIWAIFIWFLGLPIPLYPGD